MDNISCKVCSLIFDNTNLPKLMDCGHSVCLPCLKKLSASFHNCPFCKTLLKTDIDQYPTNYALLDVVNDFSHLYKEQLKMKTSATLKKKLIDQMKSLNEEIKERKEQLQFLVQGLKKIEAIDKYHISNINMDISLNCIDAIEKEFNLLFPLYKETISHETIIKLENFESKKAFLYEICQRIQEGERVFAVKKVNSQIKYGRITFMYSYFAIHCLSEEEHDNEMTLVWFEDILKTCPQPQTFLQIMSAKETELNIMIETIRSPRSYEFSYHCSGQFGLSYKHAPFVKGDDCFETRSLLCVKSMEETRASVRSKVPLREVTEDELVVLSLGNANFQIGAAVSEGRSFVIGKVVRPSNLEELLWVGDGEESVIFDCGIAVSLEEVFN